MSAAGDLAPSRSRVHYLMAGVWLATTISLASWWLTVGLSMAEHRRMFAWEGGIFLALLFAGGAVIVLAIGREHRRRRALEAFFMAFTHDLKTALASVQLQAEGLREDWPETAPSGSLERLQHDIVRLQIQLENSLFVSQPDGRLLSERVDATSAFARLAQDWPDLEVRVHGHARLRADARAFDAVCRNVLQNAVVHGGATRVDVHLAGSGDRVRITMRDNGRGVAPTVVRRLGQAFGRGTETGGTGVGLFVSRQLVSRMSGTLTFDTAPGGGPGFGVTVDLPGDR